MLLELIYCFIDRKDVFNDSLNNRQVEVYSHETNFSRKPYSEFVKNYNKLSSVLVTRDLKVNRLMGKVYKILV